MHDARGRPKAFPWPIRVPPPSWATQLIGMIRQVLHNQAVIIQNQEHSMAAIDDLTTSVQGIVSEVTVVATTLDALAAEVAAGNPVTEQQLSDLNTQLVSSLETLQAAVAKDGPSAPPATP